MKKLNLLGDSGVEAVQEALLRNKNVREVFITGYDCDYKTDEVNECIKLGKIPIEVTQLKRMESLSVINCKIQEIPTYLSSCQSLVMLDVSDNIGIKTEQMIHLVRLKRLNLNGCGLTHLPEKISALKNLETLGLEGNNFPAQEIQRIKMSLPHCNIYF